VDNSGDYVAISVNEEKFCQEMVKGTNAAEAYRKVFDTEGFSTNKITSYASRLKKDPKITARIVEMRNAAARAAIMTGAKVIEEWAAIALADHNELTQYQRNNCRHCNGHDHGYQWTDQDEWAQVVASVMEFNGAKGNEQRQKPLPDFGGGFNFAFNALPHPDCPKCRGEGVERVYIPDSRFLGPDAKRLFAGVKQTQHGIEIKTRDQDAALLNLAKYFKLLAPDAGTTINMPGSQVTVIPETELPADPAAAAKFYQDLMRAKT